jgi:hypothetical protein
MDRYFRGTHPMVEENRCIQLSKIIERRSGADDAQK